MSQRYSFYLRKAYIYDFGCPLRQTNSLKWLFFFCRTLFRAPTWCPCLTPCCPLATAPSLLPRDEGTLTSLHAKLYCLIKKSLRKFNKKKCDAKFYCPSSSLIKDSDAKFDFPSSSLIKKMCCKIGLSILKFNKNNCDAKFTVHPQV